MNISILVAAVVIFLLVLHHNFLGLSDLLKRELTGVCVPHDGGGGQKPHLCSPEGVLPSAAALCPFPARCSHRLSMSP